MDPLSLAVGAGVGILIPKLIGKKKATPTKKRTATKSVAKKTTAKRSTAKRSPAKVRGSVSKASATSKTTGRLKKGFKYAKGGRVVKASGC